nr:spore germination protein [Shouchella shacheensis]
MLEEQDEKVLSGNLEETIRFIEDLLSQNDDFVTRRFHIFGNFSAAMFYFSNLVDPSVINTDILKPLMYVPPHLAGREVKQEQLLNVLLKETIYQSETELEDHLSPLVQVLLRGKTVLIIEGLDQALHIGTRTIAKRAVDEPKTEQVILGPREGFIEQLETNLGLLRYRLQTADLQIKTLKLGRLSKTKVAICYIEGITNAEVIKEVENRLSKIDIDIIPDIGYIEQFIEDHKFSPFPQMMSTERPDKTVSNLAEGRVAVLVDGSPFSLLLPVVFNQFYQTAEDYTNRFLMGNFVRISRILALVFSLIFPSLYVSLISFHPELLPTEFAVAVSGGRAGVPYPAVVEVLFIEVAMEILREATVRLPTQVGGALSIVGVLIVGEAAVSAGFASPITVVIIALTTIGSFATPSYTASFALRMLRFPLILLAGIFGLYGVVIGIILIFNHMLSLKSFGVPYMSPVSPGNAQGWKDVVFRSSLWRLSKRPAFLHASNRKRVGKEAEEQSNETNHTRG